MSEFKGRRIVVTGGAGGIGMACARVFLGAGAIVHLVDIDAGRLEQARAQCAMLGKVPRTGGWTAHRSCP